LTSHPKPGKIEKKESWPPMRSFESLFVKTTTVSTFVSTFLFLTVFTGCSNQQPSPQEVREKTAQATAEVKSDAKAMAEGIREGWNRDKPLDLNAATKEQLVSLPGVSAIEADRIIAGRPYGEPGELVTRHLMTKSEYDKIAGRITARK
jgi:hypothetical protein